MHEHVILRMQRKISRLQNKLDNSNRAKEYWTDRAVFLAKQLKPNGTSSELLTLAGFRDASQSKR